MRILESIRGHEDLVHLSDSQREQLCREIRDFMISGVSKTGGHLASNLGVVELTVAIETVFNTAKDRLVFDVGHQSYVHKLLTGRQADFATLRQFGGIAGFPKPCESICDAFVAGHASSSVSISLGMARARTLQNEDYHIVTLLGDGAATGGMVYEGLNDAAVSNEPMIVILNDNEMSIDRNVGGMAYHLSRLRTKERYLGLKRHYRRFLLSVPGGRSIYRITRRIKDRVRRMLIPTTIFENMGFTYLGPVDGHDLRHLIALLETAKDMKRPVLLHVLTQKGRGYEPAQQWPELYHGVGKFDAVTGEPVSKGGETFSDMFGKTMLALAEENKAVCAITAAMPAGTGLLEFKKQFPSRIFDVGIAEEHAVSMAGGLAKQGMVPVVAVYSTFLQRAYDMILQDVCMQKLHAVFAVDRAGLVGEDGETHHGVFDVGFLRQAPGIQVLCPGSLAELQDMLIWAVCHQNGPVAIRYPRGGDRGYSDSAWNYDKNGVVTCHKKGKDVVLITYGTLFKNVADAAACLEKDHISAAVLRLLTVKPLPIREILSHISPDAYVLIAEETLRGSGVGQALAVEIQKDRPGCRVDVLDLGEEFVTHGSLDALYHHCKLDGKSICHYVQEALKVEN